MYSSDNRSWIDGTDAKAIAKRTFYASSLAPSTTVNNAIELSAATQSLNDDSRQQANCPSPLFVSSQPGHAHEHDNLPVPLYRCHEELPMYHRSVLDYDVVGISSPRSLGSESVINNSLPATNLCQKLYQTICLRSKLGTHRRCYPTATFFHNSRLLSCIRHRFPDENLFILSAIQILCGVVTIVVSGISLTKAVFLYQMATGMWVGSLMFVTGIQGLLAARRPIVCTLIGLLIFCLLVTLTSCLLICVSVAGIIEDGFMNPTDSLHLPNDGRLVHFHTTFGSKEPLPIMTTSASHQLPISAISLLNKRSTGDSFRKYLPHPRQDFNLRACHMILHTLLLLVGILESSVSLATSVICCRSVCSRSGRSRSRLAARTGVLSLSPSTASQAASYLRATGIDRHVGSGTFLLAVTADSLPESDIPFCRDGSERTNINPSVRTPYVHRNLLPFLSGSRSSALILTQAGENALGWTAVRATVNSINRERLPTYRALMPPRSNNCSNSTNASLPRSRRRRLRRCRYNSVQRSASPRLFMTSLRTPSRNSSIGNHQASCLTNPNPTELSCTPPGSALIYVMSSPTPEDPPMLFPPFPPSYNAAHKPSSFTSIDSQECCPLRLDQRVERSTDQETNSDANIDVNDQTIPPSRFGHRLLSTLQHIFRRNHSSDIEHRLGDTAQVSGRTPTPLVLYTGDRLLQPVLIVDDPSSHSVTSHSQPLVTEQPPPPPIYSPCDPYSSLPP